MEVRTVQQLVVVVHYNSKVEVELVNYRIPNSCLSMEQEGERNWQEKVVRIQEPVVCRQEVLRSQDRLVYH